MALLVTAAASAFQAPPPTVAPPAVEARVQGLLKVMTNAEKARQLDMYSGRDFLSNGRCDATQPSNTPAPAPAPALPRPLRPRPAPAPAPKPLHAAPALDTHTPVMIAGPRPGSTRQRPRPCWAAASASGASTTCTRRTRPWPTVLTRTAPGASVLFPRPPVCRTYQRRRAPCPHHGPRRCTRTSLGHAVRNICMHMHMYMYMYRAEHRRWPTRSSAPSSPPRATASRRSSGRRACTATRHVARPSNPTLRL